MTVWIFAFINRPAFLDGRAEAQASNNCAFIPLYPSDHGRSRQIHNPTNQRYPMKLLGEVHSSCDPRRAWRVLGDAWVTSLLSVPPACGLIVHCNFVTQVPHVCYVFVIMTVGELLKVLCAFHPYINPNLHASRTLPPNVTLL